MIYTRPQHYRLIAAVFVLMSAGCSSLPKSGPATSAIRDEASTTKAFKLVDISANDLATINETPALRLADVFGNDNATSSLILGPGDGITLSIWESGSDPLFSGMQGNTASSLASAGAQSTNSRGATLPEVIVGTDGAINLPFAGRIPVAGLSTTEAQAAIEKALSRLTQKPQVAVILTRNLNSAVTLFGEAASATRVSLSPYGEHLLDVLASSGGTRGPTYDLHVQLMRGNRSASTTLDRILSTPAENIRLMPHDQIVVSNRPRTFTAFGATGRNTQINFDMPKLSLVEAIAKSGGILDARADPKGVFLLRYEGSSSDKDNAAPTPVVYRLDLSTLGSYFLAQKFQVRDDDVLYVASAPANELQKFLELVGMVAQPAINAVVVTSAVK